MYLTAKQAAEILGITPIRVRQLVQAGKLKAIKPQRDILVIEESVRGYVRGKAGRPVRGKAG